MDVIKGLSHPAARLNKIKDRMFSPGVENWIVRYRKMIIAAVLIISFLIGLLAPTGYFKFVILLASIPMVFVLFYLSLENLWVAPISILIAGLVLPFSLSTGTMSVIVDSLILTGLALVMWIFLMITKSKVYFIRKSDFNKPLFSYFILVPISLVWSLIFRDPLVNTWGSFIFVQIAATLIMILLPALTFFAGNIIDDLKVWKIMVVIFLAFGLVGYLYEVRYTLNLEKYFSFILLEVKTEGLFTMWIISLSLGLALFDRTISNPLKIALVGLAGLWMYYRFWQNTSWMTGWFPPLVVVFTLFLMKSKKAALMFLLSLILLIAIRADYFSHALFLEQGESGSTRLSAWAISLWLTSKHFLFGTGPGGYAAYYMSYFPSNAMATHNNYLDVIAQTGIIGFGLYLWMFFALFKISLRVIRKVKGKGDFTDALAHAVFAGLIGCIVAMGFGDWMIPFPYTQGIVSFDYILYSWLFLGAILSLEGLLLNEKE